MPNIAKPTSQYSRSGYDRVSLGRSMEFPRHLWGRFFCFCAGAGGPAMKIRLPGFKTTISINFVFILIGIALVQLGGRCVIGLGGALGQYLWKTQTRPKPLQVGFMRLPNGLRSGIVGFARTWRCCVLNSFVSDEVVGACVY